LGKEKHLLVDWLTHSFISVGRQFMLKNCQKSCNDCPGAKCNVPEPHVVEENDALEEKHVSFGEQQVASGGPMAETRQVVQDAIDDMLTGDHTKLEKKIKDVCRNRHASCSLWAMIKKSWNDLCQTDDETACDRPRPLLPGRTISHADLKHHSRPGLRPKIILVGVPKSGSTSVGEFFQSAGFSTCEHICRDYVGACLQLAIADGKPPLATCGDYDAYGDASIIYPKKGEHCFFAQIQALEAIHNENPSAVFVLNLRNVTHWTTSVLNWPPHSSPHHPGSLSYQLAKCQAGPTNSSSPALAAWYCEHTQRIREFVAKHSSHTLIEIDIEDAASGEKLANFFGVDPSHWKHKNKNTKKRGEEPEETA
jgi:hypothetical protein